MISGAVAISQHHDTAVVSVSPIRPGFFSCESEKGFFS